jgi:uncharacterized protein YndB with AHSA1/START domain
MSEAETRSVVVEREFPYPPERLWRALTEPLLIAEWLMKNDFKAAIGHRFQFQIDPLPNWSGVIQSEVLLVEPEKTLSYSWNAGEGALAVECVVTFTLERTRTGTRLRVEQAGFRADQKQNLMGATYGWTNFLGRLEELLARAG